MRFNSMEAGFLPGPGLGGARTHATRIIKGGRKVFFFEKRSKKLLRLSASAFPNRASSDPARVKTAISAT
jgi:hypothetical protein